MELATEVKKIIPFKVQKHYDAPEPHLHHQYCPMSIFYGNPHKFSTLCVCAELEKADRDAVIEERADEEIEKGGI